MKRLHLIKGLLALCAVLAPAAPALAHHEAIFGPQSSLMLSADQYLSFQLFSRQTGTDTDRTQETTSLLSFGIEPIPNVPLAFTITAPFSLIRPLDGQPGGATGIEDIIVGSRYRYNFEGLQSLFGKEGNYLIGMGAVELPNGVIDHEAFQGPLDSMGSLLLSFEYAQFSLINYVFYRHNGIDITSSKTGDNLFLGGGLAYTPIDDDTILSFQLGWSYETYFKNSAQGKIEDVSGGSGLLLHPTISYSPWPGLLFFGVFSLPVWQAYADPADQDRFRVGLGAIYSW